MLFRFRYKILGGHTHIRMFSGKSESSLGKCGDLCMRNEEFEIFREIEDKSKFDCCIQFIEEENG